MQKKNDSKKNKKLLLIFIFGIVLVLIGVFGYVISKSKKVEILEDKTDLISETPKTTSSGYSVLNHKLGSYTVSEEDKDGITYIVAKGNDQIVIDQLKDESGCFFYKPFYKFSNDNKYFQYQKQCPNDRVSAETKIYNIESRKGLTVDNNGEGIQLGDFTKDSKHYFAITWDGLGTNSYVYIYNLSKMSLIYTNKDAKTISYLEQDNSLTIKNGDETKSVFSFGSEKIIK